MQKTIQDVTMEAHGPTPPRVGRYPRATVQQPVPLCHEQAAPRPRGTLIPPDALCCLSPTMGVDLRRADGAGLTWKCIDAADDIPFSPPPSKGPTIANVTTILYKGLQFCAVAASPSHSHTQNNASNTTKSTGPLGTGAHWGSSSTPAGTPPTIKPQPGGCNRRPPHTGAWQPRWKAHQHSPLQLIHHQYCLQSRPPDQYPDVSATHHIQGIWGLRLVPHCQDRWAPQKLWVGVARTWQIHEHPCAPPCARDLPIDVRLRARRRQRRVRRAHRERPTAL